MSKHSAREGVVIKVPWWVAIAIAVTISAMIGVVLPVIALMFGGHHYR
jgi:Mg/Co/Ni transporter MgtE